MPEHRAPSSSRSPGTPTVSVVIPNYNQTTYLPAALESALAQQHRPLEVIVVDDGSSDDCREVVRRFGSAVKYIFQENQGLGGARNTGIDAARGDLVGLLDADDEWMPGFLASMAALFVSDPGVSVCYCCAQAMDQEGRTSPRVFGGPPVSPDRMYDALLRANFLIPSTIVMRRDAVLSVGSFDATLRSRAGERSAQGCEDWDLWLRLLPEHRFLGTPDCLVRYRLHGNSLSANPDGMMRAARTVIEKHFGPDDGRWSTWTPEKRRAYGGLYRYGALMCARHRADWGTAATHLRLALLADESLVTDVDLFYELALGADLLGTPALGAGERVAARADDALRMVADVCGGPEGRRIAGLHRALTTTALHGLGLAAYNAGQAAKGRRLLMSAIRRRPALLGDRVVVGDIAKSFLRPLLRPAMARRS